MFFKIKLLLVTLSICFFFLNKNFAQSNSAFHNPLINDLNVPVDFAKVTGKDVSNYAQRTLSEVKAKMMVISKQQTHTFENVFTATDNIYDQVNTASFTCYILYFVSPDSLVRTNGLAGYQLMDSLSKNLFSDKGIYANMIRFTSSPAYKMLSGHRKKLVDDMVDDFNRSGVQLNAKQLTQFKKLNAEIALLSTAYSGNMNSDTSMLELDEQATLGLPNAFKATYKVAENKYAIPIINSTQEPVLNNALLETTRKAYYLKFYNRASDKNISILDSMVKKRDDLGKLMGYSSFAAYLLIGKMAKKPANVWTFINDLANRSKEKAKTDVLLLQQEKKMDTVNSSTASLQTWDLTFYRDQILKKKYQVDKEALRNYFPMKQCLKGMFDLYQHLLGVEFRKVNNASVWSEEVELYEVYEVNKLKGRFYLDLFPRPNKETWYYGYPLNLGNSTAKGYQIPTAMLLGNFTKPTATMPSLLSEWELRTLFHEFGHIVNAMAYKGEFAYQANTKDDFSESMSQIFENWILNYDILSSFAKHYKTGEVLPKTTFDKLLKARNIGSGLDVISSCRNGLYDMNLYDKYNAINPISTDQIWKDIDKQLGVMPFYVPNTHYQASWIHINGFPVYYYGYSWSRVYAQDMFTQFEKYGLRDAKTGIRYKKLILANGLQRDIDEAIGEFLGRPMNNKAYIKSLGL